MQEDMCDSRVSIQDIGQQQRLLLILLILGTRNVTLRQTWILASRYVYNKRNMKLQMRDRSGLQGTLQVDYTVAWRAVTGAVTTTAVSQQFMKIIACDV